MTQDHAERVRRSFSEWCEGYLSALGSGDMKGVEKCCLQLRAMFDRVVSESVRTRIEADALESELLLYRPREADLPPAPILDRHDYVYTAKLPWVCAAVVVRETVYITLGNYHQEHYTTEKKTVCGRQVSFPVRDRFNSGGWPRIHELCPECVRILDAADNPSQVKMEFSS